ncbi:MAG: hypothetical protein JO010_13235, partial [Alphaproteobacteria bacterium]|nr:hypothetical protein [Alphaproteobacteria bacterium]
DPGTTQITQQLMGNNVANIISNRVNGVSINTTTTLNITINNLNQLSTRLLAMPFVNGLGRDVAAFRPH